MNIILTSTGFENTVTLKKITKIINKNFNRLRMLVIPTARKYKYNKEKYLNDYIKLGFKKENIYFFNDEEPKNYKNLDIDLIYVCGGNTFLLQYYLKKCDFEKEIIKYIKNGVIYLGASTGTHIATANINHVKYFDNNEINLTDFDGLHLFNGIIICHYNKNREDIYQTLKAANHYTIETLTDEEILFYNTSWHKI